MYGYRFLSEAFLADNPHAFQCESLNSILSQILSQSSSPESGVRRIYPEDYPYGSSPEDLSVGPSVINRSRTIRN